MKQVLAAKEDSENESEKTTYKVITNGEAMDMKWFISLHSVSLGNDLNAMNEQDIKEFVTKTILYTVENKPKETENTAEALILCIPLVLLTLIVSPFELTGTLITADVLIVSVRGFALIGIHDYGLITFIRLQLKNSIINVMNFT